ISLVADAHECATWIGWWRYFGAFFRTFGYMVLCDVAESVCGMSSYHGSGWWRLVLRSNYAVSSGGWKY
ncbi:hypothetical protein, partial [Acidovorax cavernicola]|uniref:hypothetical protein n=1 Tax=Acidovorax cavernicola TaxID=1675792 RepID=UPI00197AF773